MAALRPLRALRDYFRAASQRTDRLADETPFPYEIAREQFFARRAAERNAKKAPTSPPEGEKAGA